MQIRTRPIINSIAAASVALTLTGQPANAAATGPVASSTTSALPTTGTNPALLSLAGAVFLLLGFWLVTAHRRRKLRQ